MPQYNFLCRACKKAFSEILTLSEYEKGKIVCPHCGDKNVEQTLGCLLCSDLEEELRGAKFANDNSDRRFPGWATVRAFEIRAGSRTGASLN